MTVFLRMLLALGTLWFSTSLQGQNAPYPIKLAKATITQGPYLIDPSETGMTVMWLTDSLSQSKVVYWADGMPEHRQIATTQSHGLISVDTVHSIRLTALTPGTTYHYQVKSRRVIDLRPYWPVMGLWVASDTATFTTFNRQDNQLSFSAITDTHGDTTRLKKLMQRVDWPQTDFLVHLGDPLDWLASEQQLYQDWLSPLIKQLDHHIPLVYVRGNHELRGPFARHLATYFPFDDGEFYYARNAGPAHLIVLDTGEDKPDTTNVYAGLNNLSTYRAKEYHWFKQHIKTSQSLKEAPFRILLMHAPKWGWVNGKKKKWTALANTAKINLVIAGHWHQFKRIAPGSAFGNDYTILSLDQDNIAKVSVTQTALKVIVENLNGKRVDAFLITRDGSVHNLMNRSKKRKMNHN